MATRSHRIPTAFNPRSLSPVTRFSAGRFRPRTESTHSASISRASTTNRSPVQHTKKACMCSPTTHPGSFRCSLHKNQHQTASYRPCHQSNYTLRSAMANSLVRIGTVEGDLVKRALAAMIRPSSNSVRRRVDFQPRPSRLSVMHT